MLLFLLSLSFGEKAPTEYFCQHVDDEPGSELRNCQPADFCENSDFTSFQPDVSHKDYYDNLIGKFNLACASSNKIGLIGSSFFTGWIMTLVFVPRLADIFGR